MAKIHTLKIKNYKGIQNFEQVFGLTDFICLIGRGDSGKSTILEAISAVLSPNWNLSFNDSDFYNCNISNPIEIEVSLYDLPALLTQDTKYGLYIRGLDKSTDNIHDELQDEHEAILTIRLKVDNNLEPKWFVINERDGQEDIEIKSTDRAQFNAFLISDYVDRQFSWSKGNPLYSLLKQEDPLEEKTFILLDAFRDAKKKVDSAAFAHLDATLKKVVDSSATLGVDIKGAKTTIDSKDISLNDGKICLHSGTVPFRLKGKGTKRLISLAIQLELVKTGGILLIDEIEQGLEPDRAQHLASILKKGNNGQIFITTHSRDVLVELQAEDIFRVKKSEPKLFMFDSSLQGCIRANPEAFFSEKVLVNEGSTELGICRSINIARMAADEENATFMGVRFANGNGNTQAEYASGFIKAGYDVCLFCDSDEETINSQKAGLIALGVNVVDCENKNSIEGQIFKDLPWVGIKELIGYQIQLKGEESVMNSIKAKFNGTFPNDWQNTESLEMREALAKASVAKSSEWFKRVDHGEFLGRICCQYLGEITNTHLGKQILKISEWIGHD